MFKAIFADVMQQLLQFANLDHSDPAKRVKRIVRERTLANIPANHSSRVVGREAREAHGTRLHAAYDGAECILFANGSGDDLLEIHSHILKEMLWQIATVKADGLVGIGSVIVIPVK